MKKQTSLHIQAVKGGSEQHNKREKKLDYVKQELSHLNEYWECDTQAKRLASIKERYHNTTGQKMQAKATPIREGVVVIKDDTTMKDLQRLASTYKERFGVDVFQIAIHKDEGHKGAEWKPNLHAHLVFDWTNHETGKSIKLNRDDMAEMQTIAAEVLGMDRGVSSDKKHLDAVQYKIKVLEDKVQELGKEIEGMSLTKQGKDSVFLALERLKGFFGMSDKDKEIKSLRDELKAKNEKLLQAKTAYKELQEKAVNAIKIEKGKMQEEINRKEWRIKEVNLYREREARERREAEKKADALMSMWAGREEAEAAIRDFAKDISRRELTNEERKRIDAALGTENDTQTRMALANVLSKRMGNIAGSGIVEEELKEIARREERQERNRGRGLGL